MVEPLPLPRGKSCDAITLLHADSSLTLAVLLSNCGSLNSLVAVFALLFKARILSTGCPNYILVCVLQSDWSYNIFTVGTGQEEVIPD